MQFKKSIISFVAFSSFIGLSTFLPSGKKAFAAKINCDSPVHRNRHKDCINKDGSPKRKQILDKETGLMVVEMESDYVMDKSSRRNKKIIYEQIIKLNSKFDDTTEYAVFDKNRRFGGGKSKIVITKWTSDYIKGVYSFWAGCGILYCSA